MRNAFGNKNLVCVKKFLRIEWGKRLLNRRRIETKEREEGLKRKLVLKKTLYERKKVRKPMSHKLGEYH
jgi:hypothetical protein